MKQDYKKTTYACFIGYIMDFNTHTAAFLSVI